MSEHHAHSTFPDPSFRVAALQMVSTPDRERNLAEAERLIAEAAADGAQLVLLPEYFCFMASRTRTNSVCANPTATARSSVFWRTPPAATASG
jgi:hypothetical protein